MSKIFGIPILAAVFLGLLFPYAAIQLTPYGIVFLFILMLSAGLVIDWSRPPSMKNRLRETAVGVLFALVVLPLLLWLIADLVLNDAQYLYGFVFSSLCPIALVAPYFARIHQADKELALLIVIATMALCPIIAPLMLKLLFSSSISMNLVPLTRYMLLLVTLPLVISILIARYLPSLRRGFLRFDGLVNSGFLALLVFTLFGTAVGKLNTNYLDYRELAALLFLVILQDFGVLLLARLMFRKVFSTDSATALTICMSMKNVAIAAGVLLIYDPRASFAPALAFVAHAVLFNILGFTRLTRWLRG